MTEYDKQTLIFLLIVLGLIATGFGIPIGIIIVKNIKFLNDSAVVNGIVQEYKDTPLRRSESPQHTDHLGTTVYKVVAYTVNDINYTTSSTYNISESLANWNYLENQIRICYEKVKPALSSEECNS
ncbi:MAG: hypothetical protein JW915_15160 [Chitinispirillaceae bacterium]|nr:hypothetical protein [Chitinispirillaceae bacterium]